MMSTIVCVAAFIDAAQASHFVTKKFEPHCCFNTDTGDLKWATQQHDCNDYPTPSHLFSFHKDRCRFGILYSAIEFGLGSKRIGTHNDNVLKAEIEKALRTELRKQFDKQVWYQWDNKDVDVVAAAVAELGA